MKAHTVVSFLFAGALSAPALADAPYVARGFNPAHADLPRSAGVPAQLANEDYVKALARIVYYWAYPAIDVFGRTEGMWPLMKDGPGVMNGTAPGSPVNTSACLDNYLPPAQRIVVTRNNDTFYGVAFLDLGHEPVVVQTPADVPDDADRRHLHQRHLSARLCVEDAGREVSARRSRLDGRKAGRIRRRTAPAHQLRRRLSAQLRSAHAGSGGARDRRARPDGRLSPEPEHERTAQVRLQGDREACRLSARRHRRDDRGRPGRRAAAMGRAVKILGSAR
jgi:hypothetical protein